MKYASPYTPGAGAMPFCLAGRDDALKDAERHLEALIKGYPAQPVIYYGLRGVGKTVLLNAVEKRADEREIIYSHVEAAEKRDFLLQIANASKKIIHKVSAGEALRNMGRKALGVLQAFNVTYNPSEQTFSAGLSEISGDVATGVLADDLTEMLVEMGKLAAKAKKQICFFIDEIQYMKNDEMEALVNAFHRISQLRLPVMMFGAGLPKILRIMGEVKTYSERLFKFVPVAQLSEIDARQAIVEPAADAGVLYTESAVTAILKWTRGYPFFIQEFCAILWEYTEKEIVEKTDAERVVNTYLARLDESFFRVRFEHCTKKEHDFLFAMVRCGELPCTISNVAMMMKKKVNSISPMRAQLINKGIIYSAAHGTIDFTVPLFDEYLKRINPELRLESE